MIPGVDHNYLGVWDVSEVSTLKHAIVTLILKKYSRRLRVLPLHPLQGPFRIPPRRLCPQNHARHNPNTVHRQIPSSFLLSNCLHISRSLAARRFIRTRLSMKVNHSRSWKNATLTRCHHLSTKINSFPTTMAPTLTSMTRPGICLTSTVFRPTLTAKAVTIWEPRWIARRSKLPRIALASQLDTMNYTNTRHRTWTLAPHHRVLRVRLLRL